MKKFFIISLISLFLATNIYADFATAKTKAVIVAIKLQESGFTLKGGDGQYLGNKRHKTYSAYLYAGNTYAIIGVGDENVNDLDVRIYDRDWNLIANDSDSSAISAVKFYVGRSGTYYIKTKMYSGSGYFYQIVGWK